MSKTQKANSKKPRPYWFVNGTDDQAKRFIEEGIWENESHSKKNLTFRDHRGRGKPG